MLAAGIAVHCCHGMNLVSGVDAVILIANNDLAKTSHKATHYNDATVARVAVNKKCDKLSIPNIKMAFSVEMTSSLLNAEYLRPKKSRALTLCLRVLFGLFHTCAACVQCT